MYIKIEKNPDGSHEFQSGGIMQDGWAFIPYDMEIPKTSPFVDIEVEEITYPAVMTTKKEIIDGEIVETPKVLIPEYTRMEVISMIEREETFIEEQIFASQLDIIEAQVAYTAMMTDTLLEV